MWLEFTVNNDKELKRVSLDVYKHEYIIHYNESLITTPSIFMTEYDRIATNYKLSVHRNLYITPKRKGLERDRGKRPTVGAERDDQSTDSSFYTQ